MKELRAMKGQNGKDMQVQQQQLMMLLNIDQWLLPVAESLEKLPVSANSTNGSHPLIALQEQNVNVASANVRVQKQGMMRSEEHTSELQSLMRISYAVFCLKK